MLMAGGLNAWNLLTPRGFTCNCATAGRERGRGRGGGRGKRDVVEEREGRRENKVERIHSRDEIQNKCGITYAPRHQKEL